MTHTDRSGNEVYATALKAARGAKVPMGQADACAKVLSAGGDDDVFGAFADHLDRPARQAVVTCGTALHIANTQFLRDASSVVDALDAGCDVATLAPLTIDPFITAFCTYHGLTATSDGSGGVDFRKDGQPPMPLPKRAMVADAVWRRLNRWASKTYVPETEATRLSGAGAGLTDND